MKKTILTGLTALLISCAKPYNTPESKMELAQCLIREGAVMYGAEWCGYCTKEKEVFGPAWEVMKQNYVECTEEANVNKCKEIAVNGEISVPSWKFKNGKIIRGYSPNFLEVLARESGCDN